MESNHVVLGRNALQALTTILSSPLISYPVLSYPIRSYPILYSPTVYYPTVLSYPSILNNLTGLYSHSLLPSFLPSFLPYFLKSFIPFSPTLTLTSMLLLYHLSRIVRCMLCSAGNTGSDQVRSGQVPLCRIDSAERIYCSALLLSSLLIFLALSPKTWEEGTWVGAVRVLVRVPEPL